MYKFNVDAELLKESQKLCISIEIVQKALGKVVVTEDLPVYKAFINEKLNQNNFNVFDINPEIEIENIIKQKNK